MYIYSKGYNPGGKEEATLSIVKNMLVDNIDVKAISKYTNLSIDEINALKNN